MITDVVVLQPREAVVVHVLVGDDVVLVAQLVEPVDQMQVGRVLPRRLHQEVVVLRPDAEDRPEPRREAEAAPVGMGVVDRAAILAMLGQEHVLVLHDRHAVDQQLRPARVVGEMLVGVGHVADRRHHHRDLGLLLPRAGHDEERDVVLVAFLRGELHAVGIALIVRRDGPFEVDLPSARRPHRRRGSGSRHTPPAHASSRSCCPRSCGRSWPGSGS